MNRTPLRVLLVEDRADDAELLMHELNRSGFDCTWTRAETEEEYLRGLDDVPEIIIADYMLPHFSAPNAIKLCKERGLDTPVIVVSGVMSDETCVQVLRLGAVDYLLKDRMSRLPAAVRHALEQRDLHRFQREAEQALRRSADLVQSVVNNAPAMIYLVDVLGNYILVNQEFERCYRLAPAEAVGRAARDVLPAEVAQQMADHDEYCARRRAIVEREEILQIGREVRYFLSIRYPLVDDGGEVYAIGAIYADISRQKRIEDDLRATRERLQQQADELTAANVELRQLDRQKDEFISTVTHELRTPLTSIRGYTEVLANGWFGPLRDIERRVVEVLDRNCARLLGLVDDLLTVSRMDGGTFTLLSGPVDLAGLMEQLRASLAPTLPEGLQLEVDLPEGLPTVHGDRGQLERAFSNLVTNAIKFSPDGGVINVRARPGFDELTITVADSGIGIPPEEQHLLFSRFYRASTAESLAIQGTGLGLTITKAIVERHGGSIAIESLPAAGTTVIVTLPLAPAGPAGPAPAVPAGLAPVVPAGLAPVVPAGLAPGEPPGAQAVPPAPSADPAGRPPATETAGRPPAAEPAGRPQDIEHTGA